MVLTPEYLKHATPQEAIETMKEAKRRRKEGAAKLKDLKFIGCIPFSVFHQHPDLWTDDKSLRKWLRQHPEFSAIRNV